MRTTQKQLLHDPLHLAIQEAMVDCLNETGEIWIVVILKMAKVQKFMEPHIRWDLLIKGVAKKTNTKFIPQSQYSRRNVLGTSISGKELVIQNPMRYLLPGSGGKKQIAGWISAGNIKHEKTIRAAVDHRIKVSDGLRKSADEINCKLEDALAVSHDQHQQIS